MGDDSGYSQEAQRRTTAHMCQRGSSSTCVDAAALVLCDCEAVVDLVIWDVFGSARPAGSCFESSATAQIQHELFVRSFKSSALVVVGLNTLFQALDRVILGCQTTRIVDGALGIVSILSLQRQNSVFQSSVFRAQSLRQPLALVHSRFGDNSTTAADG